MINFVVNNGLTLNIFEISNAILVVHLALSYSYTPQLASRKPMNESDIICLLALYCSLRLLLELFHLQSLNTELSVIYTVHYSCHGSPYEL